MQHSAQVDQESYSELGMLFIDFSIYYYCVLLKRMHLECCKKKTVINTLHF